MNDTGKGVAKHTPGDGRSGSQVPAIVLMTLVVLGTFRRVVLSEVDVT